METRKCKVCNESKELIQFAKKIGKDKHWYKHTCLVCFREKKRADWHLKGRKEGRAIWSKTNIEKDRAYKKKYRDSHKIEGLAYSKGRRGSDPQFKLIGNLRHRIWLALRGDIKSQRTIELLGCSIDQFKIYLESIWLPNMTWENYGVWKKGSQMTWHIDHIRPCSSFDLTDSKQQKVCFHYSNMQPLWAIDNIVKSDSYHKGVL